MTSPSGLAQPLRYPHPPRVHEGRLPDWLPEPHGPDVTVFGPRRDSEPDEEGGVISSRCRAHAVEWSGSAPCWCCEAGIPEVTA